MQIAGEHCHTQSNPSGLYFAYIELAMTSGWHGMQAVINAGHGNELTDVSFPKGICVARYVFTINAFIPHLPGASRAVMHK